MKTKLVILPMIFILCMAIAMASTCYQENADDVNSCVTETYGTYSFTGRFNKTQPTANFSDSNWNTYIKTNSTQKYTPVYVYASWWKPSGATSASKWSAKVNSSPVLANYTISTACWEYDANYVYFRIAGVNSTAGKSIMNLSCLTAAGTWTSFKTFTITTSNVQPRFYEDAMYWDINDDTSDRNAVCHTIMNTAFNAFNLAAIAIIVLIAAMIIGALSGVTDIKANIVIAITSSIIIVLSIYVISMVAQQIC